MLKRKGLIKEFRYNWLHMWTCGVSTNDREVSLPTCQSDDEMQIHIHTSPPMPCQYARWQCPSLQRPLSVDMKFSLYLAFGANLKLWLNLDPAALISSYGSPFLSQPSMFPKNV